MQLVRFAPTEDEAVICARLEVRHGELTREWKRRHREAVKSRRRRGGERVEGKPALVIGEHFAWHSASFMNHACCWSFQKCFITLLYTSMYKGWLHRKELIY